MAASRRPMAAMGLRLADRPGLLVRGEASTGRDCVEHLPTWVAFSLGVEPLAMDSLSHCPPRHLSLSCFPPALTHTHLSL